MVAPDPATATPQSWREEGGVWLLRSPHLSSPAAGHPDVHVHAGARPCPTAGCLEGEHWSWDPRGLHTMLLGGLPGFCQDWHQLRTNVPSPLWLEAVGRAVARRAVSALCPRALARRKRVKGLNYVLSRKGFCSERQAGQMCRFSASRRKTRSG